MSAVPKYPFRVLITRRNGGGDRDLHLETHNYENLPGAWAYRAIALGKPMTVKVEIVAVIDEAFPSRERQPGGSGK